MGPGSFGTGKLPASVHTITSSDRSFNGARFFWNREGRTAAVHSGRHRDSFNGARFFWNREDPALKLLADYAKPELQWGPVLLEPGRTSLRAAGWVEAGFNGARFFWNREARPDHPARPMPTASMGPGSFGTGKQVGAQIVDKIVVLMLQWGPVLLEPGRRWQVVRG